MPDAQQPTETFDSINQWQRATFPDATVSGVVGHVVEEWNEFLSAVAVDERVEEAVDLIMNNQEMAERFLVTWRLRCRDAADALAPRSPASSKVARGKSRIPACGVVCHA